jgi:hypothetical protein
MRDLFQDTLAFLATTACVVGLALFFDRFFS